MQKSVATALFEYVFETKHLDSHPTWTENTFYPAIKALIYQLGGYPVLKKWLGYRQADRQAGEAPTDDERKWFRQVIQRIAALLALGPELDALYQRAALTPSQQPN